MDDIGVNDQVSLTMFYAAIFSSVPATRRTRLLLRMIRTKKMDD